MTRQRVRTFIGVLAVMAIGDYPPTPPHRMRSCSRSASRRSRRDLRRWSHLVPPGDGSGLFVVDQGRPDPRAGARRRRCSRPFLDLRSRMVALMPGFDERGLLGLAFHPQYASNGRFFVYYTAPLRAGAPAGFNATSHISEFRVSAGQPNRADPASERILLQVDKPQFNHNGGALQFGPDDGNLYISVGDGGGANDVGLGHVADWYADNGGGNGQDVTQNLLGNVLRIDVDGGVPYGIPSDNPFAASPGLDECGRTDSATRGACPSTSAAPTSSRGRRRSKPVRGGQHRRRRRQLRLERQGGDALLRRREPEPAVEPPALTSSARDTHVR